MTRSADWKMDFIYRERRSESEGRLVAGPVFQAALATLTHTPRSPLPGRDAPWRCSSRVSAGIAYRRPGTPERGEPRRLLAPEQREGEIDGLERLQVHDLVADAGRTLVHRPSSRHRASIVRPTGSISHAWDPRARVDAIFLARNDAVPDDWISQDPAGRVREMEGIGRFAQPRPSPAGQAGTRGYRRRGAVRGSGRICQRSGPSSQPSGRKSILPSVTAAAATRSAGHGLAWSSPSRIFRYDTASGSPDQVVRRLRTIERRDARHDVHCTSSIRIARAASCTPFQPDCGLEIQCPSRDRG